MAAPAGAQRTRSGCDAQCNPTVSLQSRFVHGSALQRILTVVCAQWVHVCGAVGKLRALAGVCSIGGRSRRACLPSGATARHNSLVGAPLSNRVFLSLNSAIRSRVAKSNLGRQLAAAAQQLRLPVLKLVRAGAQAPDTAGSARVWRQRTVLN